MTFAFDVLGPAPLDPAAEQTMVPMRDGVHLATDVYLPDGHGRAPAVLVRLPYDKCGRYTFMPALAPYFTERGYAFVVQDVRGKFRSEGETLAFTHEVEDGYDTIDWMVGQAWCDGMVGMWGDSYYGYTQWAAVASGHPALKAIVPRVTSADLEVFCGWWGNQVLPLYGADYLAHYWLDQNIYGFLPDVTMRPLCASLRRAVRGHRRALAEPRHHGRPSRTGERLPLPEQAPIRRAQGAGAQLGRLVRQHLAILVRGLRAAHRATGAGAVAVPGRRLHRP